MVTDSYVIRIYRRERKDPRLVVGILEEANGERKWAFSSFEELQDLITSPRRGTFAKAMGDAAR